MQNRNKKSLKNLYLDQKLLRVLLAWETYFFGVLSRNMALEIQKMQVTWRPSRFPIYIGDTIVQQSTSR